MTEQYEKYRKAIKNLIDTALGRPHEVRTYFGQQITVSGSVTDIIALPSEGFIEMQILDSSDPNYGEILFGVDISTIDEAIIL